MFSYLQLPPVSTPGRIVFNAQGIFLSQTVKYCLRNIQKKSVHNVYVQLKINNKRNVKPVFKESSRKAQYEIFDIPLWKCQHTNYPCSFLSAGALYFPI